MNPGFADWYDISDPRAILAMAAIDISKADKLRDRREMKRVFHAFGVVTNEADGRKVTFPAASVGKMLYMSGIDIHGIAAEFANLYRRSLRAWSEPNRKIPVSDKRRAIEAVHQYIAKFCNSQGENIGGKSPRAEVHASVISRIAIYKAEGVALSTPVKTQAEDSTPFTDDKIAYYLSTVNSGGKFWDN